MLFRLPKFANDPAWSMNDPDRAPGRLEPSSWPSISAAPPETTLMNPASAPAPAATDSVTVFATDRLPPEVSAMLPPSEPDGAFAGVMPATSMPAPLANVSCWRAAIDTSPDGIAISVLSVTELPESDSEPPGCNAYAAPTLGRDDAASVKLPAASSDV